jgi:hypothetical protein
LPGVDSPGRPRFESPRRSAGRLAPAMHSLSR